MSRATNTTIESAWSISVEVDVKVDLTISMNRRISVTSRMKSPQVNVHTPLLSSVTEKRSGY